MHVTQILTEKAVFPRLEVSCDKQALTYVAGEASRLTRIPERTIFNALMERERLGSTGVGEGVAIPHARLKGLERITAMFVRLSHAVPFHAKDGKPVDLMFVLLVPENEHGQHLKALARISRILSDTPRRNALREATNALEIYALLTEEKERAA